MSERQKTPWHLWVVGIVALIWNAFGLLDFVMTQIRNPQYMSAFNQQQLDFFYSFPIWTIVAWAIGTCGSVLGAILLLLRNSFCVPVFWASLAGLLVTTTHNFFLSDVKMNEIAGDAAIAFTVLIYFITLLLIWYSSLMRTKKVLN